MEVAERRRRATFGPLAMIVLKRPILWHIALWGTLFLMVAVAGIAVWAYTRHDSPTLIHAIGMIVLTFAQVFVGLLILLWRKLRKLRPLLANIPTTDLRITTSDMHRQTTNAMSIRQLILLGAINVMTCSSLLISAIIFLLLGRSLGFFYLAGGLPFGALAIVYYRRLIDRVENAPARAVASA